MKKLLFVIISLYNGGAEKSLVNLLNELPADKYEVDLLLFRQEGMFLKQVPKHVQILETPKNLAGCYGPLAKGGLFSLIKFIATLISRTLTKNKAAAAGFRWKYFYSRMISNLPQKYDVAIAYMSGESTYFINEKVNAKRKLTWVHNDYKKAGFSDKYDRLHFNKMNAVVTVSEECLNVLNEVFPEISEKTYNLANITSSTVIKTQANAFIPVEFEKKSTIILSIGRLSEQKGFDMAIEAASILKQRNISFKWYVIGDGILKTELNKKISKLDVKDCFQLLGSKENPYPYIKNCTVFAQTSRYEGKSVVLDEAKILAKPIVVTKYPTVSDQIEDGKEGMVVSMNSESIADGIQKMLDDLYLRLEYEEYLSRHEYGNQCDVEKYCALFEE